MKKCIKSFIYLGVPAGILIIIVFLTAFQKEPANKESLNVLFIAVDDLRPELSSYGINEIISPNIDKLSANGILFERAYCQQAVCSPSRTSLLTGLRPDSTHVYDLRTHFRKTVPDVVTLPQYFKNNGYFTTWYGKMYHGALWDDISWSQQRRKPARGSNWRDYQTAENIAIAAENKGIGPAFEIGNVPDNAYADGRNTDSAIELLKQLSNDKKPFFLALGFVKPHLPFNAPKKYWDMYDPAAIELPAHKSAPENSPKLASTTSGELRAYSDIPKKGELSDDQTRQLIHGYRASVSYIDAQIGRVMAELERLGLDKNTVVVLWGDHGFKLGDYGQWAKHTNFEIDTRVPLIISMPGMKAKGKKTRALVELVDIYPTLTELADLPKPAHVKGISLVPLLDNPDLPWKQMAFSQYPRGQVMGYSMRTEWYRYTRWQQKNNPDEMVAVELYDLEKDPQALVNVAGKRQNKQVIKQLRATMKNTGIGTKALPELNIN